MLSPHPPPPLPAPPTPIPSATHDPALTKLYETIDINKDGDVSFEEFQRFYEQALQVGGGSHTDRLRDRQADRLRDRQTGRLTDRLTDRLTVSQIDRQRDRRTDTDRH